MTLAQRLALVVGGLIAALLLALGIYLEGRVGRLAQDALDEELRAHADAIAAEVELERDGELDAEDAIEVAGGHDFRIETRDGRLLYTTTADWPAAGGRLGRSDGRDARGVRHRVLSRTFTPEHGLGDEPLVLRVAARSTAVDTVVGRFRAALVLALAIGLGAGAVAAFVLARASLRPLRRLAAAVARVEETALDRRLDEEGLPRDLRPLAASFNDLLGRVESAFGRQRAFVARASHALRTPATGILARAEVALRRERSEAEYREALADVAVLARESADTVTRMLAVMRIDDPTRQLQLVTLRLAEVADEAKRLFAPRATLAGVGLRWDVPDDAELTADRDALRELLDVLLDNALRYTPAGGEIGLRVSVAGDATELEVWDTGPGIPPAEREQVFERFYRGSAAEKTGAAGSGLGLAIARSVVQAHGATIALADRAGGGARVLVRFPTSPPSLMSGGAHRPRGR